MVDIFGTIEIRVANGLDPIAIQMDVSSANRILIVLVGKLSTRFRRENGPLGSSSERRVLVGNFPEPERSRGQLFGWKSPGYNRDAPAHGC